MHLSGGKKNYKGMIEKYGVVSGERDDRRCNSQSFRTFLGYESLNIATSQQLYFT